MQLDLDTMEFSQRLVQLRKEHNLSQSALAQKLEIHANVVGRYERGEANPSIEQVMKIADVFGVSLDYLTGKVEEAIEPKLMKHMISLQKLPNKEREYILFTIEALVRDTMTRLSYTS